MWNDDTNSRTIRCLLIIILFVFNYRLRTAKLRARRTVHNNVITFQRESNNNITCKHNECLRRRAYAHTYTHMHANHNVKCSVTNRRIRCAPPRFETGIERPTAAASASGAPTPHTYRRRAEKTVNCTRSPPPLTAKPDMRFLFESKNTYEPKNHGE